MSYLRSGNLQSQLEASVSCSLVSLFKDTKSTVKIKHQLLFAVLKAQQQPHSINRRHLPSPQTGRQWMMGNRVLCAVIADHFFFVFFFRRLRKIRFQLASLENLHNLNTVNSDSFNKDAFSGFLIIRFETLETKEPLKTLNRSQECSIWININFTMWNFNQFIHWYIKTLNCFSRCAFKWCVYKLKVENWLSWSLKILYSVFQCIFFFNGIGNVFWLPFCDCSNLKTPLSYFKMCKKCVT